MLRHVPAAPLLVVVSIGCNSSPAQTVVNGPAAVTGTAPAHVINVTDPERADAAGLNVRKLREVQSIYLGTGADRSEPTDIAIAPDGDMLVADGRVNQIFAVSADGTAHEMIARDVAPQFQLRRPHSVVLLSGGIVAVADSSSAIKLFVKAGYSLSPLRLIKAAHIDDACGISDVIAVRSAYDDAALIRMYDADGKVVQSYGSQFAHRSEMVRRAMSGGSLGCLSSGRRVIAVSSTLPLVEAYSGDGGRMWTTRIEGLRLRSVVTGVGDRGEFVSFEGASVYDVPAAVNSIGENLVLVQFARVTLPPRGDRGQKPIASTDIDVQVHSVLLSAQTGAGQYLGTAVPLVLEARGANIYTATLNKSGPIKIATYKFEG